MYYLPEHSYDRLQKKHNLTNEDIENLKEAMIYDQSDLQYDHDMMLDTFGENDNIVQIYALAIRIKTGKESVYFDSSKTGRL
jgi:hypothetical protein